MARDPYFRQTIEREFIARGARVEYILGNYDETPEGEVRKDLDATFAKWENAKRVERCNRGKKRKAEMGKVVMSRAYYGYRIDPNAFAGLAVYEPEAEVVRMIFSLFVESQLSLHEIARELNRLGVKTYHQNEVWAKSSVRNTLANTAYVGYFYYNKHKTAGKRVVKRDHSEWIKIPCTPLVPEDLFEAAQELLKHNREHRRNLPKHFYMLAGMGYCAHCEKQYVSHFAVSGGRIKPKSYLLGYLHKMRQGHCSNKWLNGKRLERLVWDNIVNILLNPMSLREGYEQIIEQEQQKQARQIKHLETLQMVVDKLKAKKSRLQAIYLDPDIGMTKEEFLGEKKLLHDQIQAANLDIQNIEKDLRKIPTENELRSLEQLAEKIVGSLGNNFDISPQDKRHVMKMLNLRVVVSLEGRLKLEGWFKPESDGLLFTTS